MTFREGLESARNDLSKGFVPVMFVVALLAPAFYVGQKVEGVRRDQRETSKAITTMQKTLEDEVGPALREIAQIQAQLDKHDEMLESRQLGIELNKRSLMEIEIALGKAGIEVN